MRLITVGRDPKGSGYPLQVLVPLKNRDCGLFTAIPHAFTNCLEKAFFKKCSSNYKQVYYNCNGENSFEN